MSLASEARQGIHHPPRARLIAARATGRRLAAGLPLLLAVLMYAETLRSPWQYDDWVTVAGNPALASLRSALSPADMSEGYRPVTAASYAVDAAWERVAPGLVARDSTVPFHATNVAIHGIVVLLVAALALRWWADPLAAGLAAAVVAVHPFNAEAVNYVSARASLLAACWELAALGAYTLWVGSSRRRGAWLAASLGASALALGAKESAVTLPVLLWLVDRLVIAPDLGWRARARRQWPWWGLVAAYLLVRLFAFTDVSGGADYSEGARIAAWRTGLAVVWMGARDWLWPFRLGVDHGVEVVSIEAGIGAAALTLVVLVLTVWGWSRRRTFIVLAPWWWAIAAVPAMILPFITHVALYQENRFYLSGVGLAWGAGWMGAAGWRWARARWGAGVPAILGVLILAGLVVMTHARNVVWKTEIALWTDAVKTAPGSALAHNMLGAAYLAERRSGPAVPVLEEAVRLDPAYPRAASNLGAAYAMQGRWDEAIARFRRALALDPAFHHARRNLADAYERTGRRREALAEYDALRRAMPDDVEVSLRFGATALRLEEWSRAEEAFRAILERDGRSSAALFNLGLVEEGRARWDEASRYYRLALAVDASDPDGHFRLGLLASRAGRDDEAVSEYEAALTLAPDHYLAHANLARVYEGRGQADLAAEHYRRFLAAAPGTADWAEARRSAEARLRELLRPRGRVAPRPSPDSPSRPPRSAAGP